MTEETRVNVKKKLKDISQARGHFFHLSVYIYNDFQVTLMNGSLVEIVDCG